MVHSTATRSPLVRVAANANPLVNRRCPAQARVLRGAAPAPSLAPWLCGGRSLVWHWSRHLRVAARFPRTPRHMPRRASRSLGCAVAARRLLPLSPLPPVAFAALMPAAAANPCIALHFVPLHSRAGSSARLRWGGAGLSAASPE
jgi:hypothetical protein